MVVPHSFCPDRCPAEPGVLVLSEPPRPRLSPTVDRCPLALPVDPALFLSVHNADASTDVARHSPGAKNPVHAFNAPTRNLSHFGSFLAPRKSPELRAKTPVTRASSGNRNGHSEPCQGASSGTKNHPAPNDPKLGRLHRARQGLVRVPESNTKYGGKLGKIGVLL